jgi:hypothetical protein
VKYTDKEVAGKSLYCDSSCIIEAIMHAHVNKPPVRKGAAKIWIHADGRSEIADKGDMSDAVLAEAQEFIKANIILMRRKWAGWSGTTIEAIVYYRGDLKECWTCEHGQYILGDKTYYGNDGDLKWVRCVCPSLSEADPQKLITAYGGKECKCWEKQKR